MTPTEKGLMYLELAKAALDRAVREGDFARAVHLSESLVCWFKLQSLAQQAAEDQKLGLWDDCIKNPLIKEDSSPQGIELTPIDPAILEGVRDIMSRKEQSDGRSA